MRSARRSAFPINAIVEAVTDTIEETPPELVADMMLRGIDAGRRWFVAAGPGRSARIAH